MANNTVEKVQGSASVISLTQSVEVISPWKMASQRFVRNKLAIAGLVIILFVGFLALAADVISPFDPKYQGTAYQDKEPGFVDPVSGKIHLFGTDDLGRDLLARMMYGARVSLMVPLVVELGVVFIGIPIGLVAGFFGGLVDDLIMRFTDIMYAFPGLLLIIILVAVFGRSVWIICIGLAIGNIPTLVRIGRGQDLQV